MTSLEQPILPLSCSMLLRERSEISGYKKLGPTSPPLTAATPPGLFVRELCGFAREHSMRVESVTQDGGQCDDGSPENKLQRRGGGRGLP